MGWQRGNNWQVPETPRFLKVVQPNSFWTPRGEMSVGKFNFAHIEFKFELFMWKPSGYMQDGAGQEDSCCLAEEFWLEGVFAHVRACVFDENQNYEPERA